MSVPEMWQWEKVQMEKSKLESLTIKLTDLGTGNPCSDIQVTAIPRPRMLPAGRSRTKTYKANSDGIASLHNLPSGAESWITINGYSPMPVSGLLDDGQITIGDVLIEWPEHGLPFEMGQPVTTASAK